ncbi:MAG TPA: FAD-dependent oxidoreductase [Chthonomonadaceae bacterium]|nr:FAD-dependent oxidoreductase [Chthonomonadaceae bacterium]
MLLFGSAGAGAQAVSAPRALEAIAVSPTAIRLYWLPAEDATGYRVERDGQVIANLPADAQTYDDTQLAPDSTHRYSVRAVNAGGESAPRVYVERTFAPFPTGLQPGKIPVVHYDVVVAQASSGGVAAAIEAARRGLAVALIEPTTRLGGMPVNGLSATDLRRPQHASGFFVRFADRVRDLYAAEGVKTNGLSYEPRVAHQAMKSLLYETPNLAIFRRARPIQVIAHTVAPRTPFSAAEQSLPGYEPVSPNFALHSGQQQHPHAPEAPRRRVDAILVEELDAEGRPTGRRAEFRAEVFIDATDCGDIAAWAGAPYRVGREPRTASEPHAGVIYYDRAHDRLLPGSTGAGDTRLQSYAYLLTVKDYGPGADKTIPPPPGYRKENYIHTPAWKESWAVTSGKMPNAKYELNQHPQGNDLQAINYGYPTGDYRERARVEALYRNHVLGYLYYIQTQQGQRQIGLPDDEYRDSGGFPPLLYVREGRRILGEQLPLEADITQARSLIRPESAGLGDYPMDSHAVRPKTDWTTPDMGEGEWWLYQYTPWHQLPLGVIVPQRLDNVFVTTAVSSTHVSYGTYRLEPVRMAFGQAAGIAANLCIRYGLTAREVPAREVQDDLLPHPANPVGDPNAVLYYLTDVRPGHPDYRAIQYLVSRGLQLTAEELQPDAPTTRGELARWLTRLAERAAPPPETLAVLGTAPDGGTEVLERQAYYPYMGAPADLAALKALQEQPDQAAVVTRAEIARWLVSLLPAVFPPAGAASGRYADVSTHPDREAIEALAAGGIDSRLWDGTQALSPEDTLYFRPDAPLSHAALFQTLYLVQRNLGPLFFDNPVDGRNGRAVPSVPYQVVRVRRSRGQP